MKKLLLLLALLILFSLFSSSAFAQVSFADARLSRVNSANLLLWHSSSELDNLGFFLFRLQDGHLSRLNSSLIPGAVLKASDARSLPHGSSYSWTDTEGSPTAQYYLQAITTDGEKLLFGPITFGRGGEGASLSQSQSFSSEQLEAASPPNSTGDSTQAGWPSSFGLSRSLRVSGTNSAASLLTQQTIAAQPAVKVLINKRGWYRLTQPELIAAGLDPSADSRNLHLYVSGVEVPMRVNSAAGPMSAADTIEFYATALDTPMTDTQVYWLVAESLPGLRVPVNGGQTATPATAPQSFAYTVERKDRTVYFSSLLNGDVENFFGAVIASSAVSQTLTLPHVASSGSGSANLEIALQGVTYQLHQIQVFLNNSSTALGTINFDGRFRTVVNLPVSMSALVEGANTVKFVGVSGDVNLVDYIRLSYQHTYQADNDALNFSAVSGQVVSVSGFTTSQIRLIDITDPLSVQEVTPTIEAQGAGYALRFAAGGSGTRNYYALTESMAQHPAGIVKNQASSWNSSSNGADFIILTHGDFVGSVQALAKMRRSQGWTVAVVDVEDVYDEYSYGTHSVQGVKDFLSGASKNWKKRPGYVLMMGRASYDPRNYGGGGKLDLVPTKLVDATYSEAASDEWLADFDGDNVAEMALGRLPARTVAEADQMIARVVGYAPSTVNQSALFVADSSDPGFTFELDNREAAAQLPDTIGVQYLDRSVVANDGVMRSQITSGINQGPMLVNYAGHGNLEVWRSVFTTTDALALSNGNRLPVFILMTCLNGYFVDPGLTSFAEGLMKAQNGGAVAVWASSGETVPAGQQVMDKQLYQSLFSNQNPALGDAVHSAKVATLDIDVRLTWILFGDPTMRMKPAASINSTSVTVTGTETTQAVFTVTLSGTSSQTVTVNYATADGTAKAGVDYIASAGSITFNPGETTKTISISVNPQTRVGPSKSFFVNLLNPTNAGLDIVNVGSSTVTNPNIAGTLQFSASNYTVPENAGSVLVTLRRTDGNASGVTIDYATSDGTAHAGSDYPATSGTVTFGFGELSKTISIPVTDDTVNEGNETINLTLSRPTDGATIGSLGTTVLTIIDDDVPMLRFSNANFTVNENAGSASISVIRIGDISRPATVDYSTSEGTATQRTDYTAASGTLSFAAGEASKAFTVLITDDAFVDGNRTVNISMSNPNGGSLLAQSTATLTIADNDVAQPTTNPADNAQFFVRQQYADFLNRAPEDEGLGYWSNEITKCGSDAQCIHDQRVAVADAFFFEPEAQQTSAYIYRIYRAAIGLRPTYAQFSSDRGRVVAGPGLEQSKNDYALYFTQTIGFQQEYATTNTAAQFVDLMLTVVRNYSGVDLSAQRASLINLYDGKNTGKAAILRQVAESQQFIDAEYNKSFVLMEYFGYLRRDPDQEGFDFWLAQVNKFPLRHVGIQHAMACSFITSAEYQTRFSSVVTHTNRECPN